MTHTHKYSLFAIALSLCLSPGCVELEPAELKPKGGCSTPMCGANSPSLLDYSASEIHQHTMTVKTALGMEKAAGVPNQDGLYLVKFLDPNGTTNRWEIEPDGELIIPDPTGGGYLSGPQVVGSVFHMRHNDPLFQDQYLKIIDYHKSVPYWLGPVETIHSYAMTYSPDPNGPPSSSLSLCPGPYTEPPPTADEYRDVVFTYGERYGINNRQIFDRGSKSEGWTNLHCLGDGGAKSTLLRHDPKLSQTDTYYTEWKQRQALLYMFAADYCADGSVFTYQGHLLRYQDRNGWLTPDLTNTEVEAIWDENGPVCLDTPRWLSEYDKADVLAECGGISLPSCSEAQFDNWEDNYYFKSWRVMSD